MFLQVVLFIQAVRWVKLAKLFIALSLAEAYSATLTVYCGSQPTIHHRLLSKVNTDISALGYSTFYN